MDPSLNQPTVNAFVTELLINSDSVTKLSAFLETNQRVTYDVTRQIWVVYP
jgi:hypothetical protein